jgi:hypothetical protein
MQLVNRKSEVVNGEWLPDMDLNHDKQIQSLLCYRYTIGQTDVWHRLGNFAGQSSRQAGSRANGLDGFDVRPHPGPLPRGAGETARISRKLRRYDCNRQRFAIFSTTPTTTSELSTANRRRRMLPLQGESARVRAVVLTNISRIKHHASS